jgi:hypothetical protein
LFPTLQTGAGETTRNRTGATANQLAMMLIAALETARRPTSINGPMSGLLL